MRKKIVIANWKMNEEYQEGLSLFSEVIDIIKVDVTGPQQVVVCCPFIHLHSLVQLSNGYSNIWVGAQNCYHEESGAYTGEISAGMIRSTGAKHVVVGHSERRKYFAETNEQVAQKVDAALKNLLIPVVCIGESKTERETNRQFDILKQQLEQGVFHLDKYHFSKLIIAYEPIWAIGTGETATAAQAQEIHAFIRGQIAAKYNYQTADVTSILYGGSCTPENSVELFCQPDIDGGLIGGASLNSRDFVDIVMSCN